MGRAADEIVDYYTEPYGRRPPPSLHTGRGVDEPVDVLGQPGLLTTVPPAGPSLLSPATAAGWVHYRVPLGPAWPVLAIVARQAIGVGVVRHAGRFRTGNRAFDSRYRVSHPGVAPAMLARLVDPRVQDALCASDRVRFVRMERVLWIQYALRSAQDDPAEARRYVVRLAETLLRSPALPLGRGA